jgi:uncharacterized membrane protein
MKRLLGLLRGFPGHPLHPPLTDATVGSLTLGTILVLASWLGLAESKTVAGGLLALAVGLVLAVPTVLTGFVDYLDIPRGTARWRTATLHWLAMVSATGVFLVAAALLQDDFDAGEAGAAGALCALGALLLLTLGGWLGGTLVFVHGERVLDETGEPTTRAVVPQAIEREPVPEVDAPEGAEQHPPTS